MQARPRLQSGLLSTLEPESAYIPFNLNLTTFRAFHPPTPRAAGAPSTFFCTISMELMRDPVLLPTGQTYERRAIEEWLSRGGASGARCPATGVELEPDVKLIPNLAMRQSIEEWAAAHCPELLGSNGSVKPSAEQLREERERAACARERASSSPRPRSRRGRPGSESASQRAEGALSPRSPRARPSPSPRWEAVQGLRPRLESAPRFQSFKLMKRDVLST